MRKPAPRGTAYMRKPDREGGRNIQLGSYALAHARACAFVCGSPAVFSFGRDKGRRGTFQIACGPKVTFSHSSGSSPQPDKISAREPGRCALRVSFVNRLHRQFTGITRIIIEGPKFGEEKNLPVDLFNVCRDDDAGTPAKLYPE